MITRGRISRPIWRLFYQRPTPGWEGVQAASAGFTGAAADVIVDDEWQLARLQDTQNPYQLMSAAMGYMMKLAKNAHLAASEQGDQLAIRQLQDVCQQLANDIMLATNEVRQLARARGYDPSY